MRTHAELLPMPLAAPRVLPVRVGWPPPIESAPLRVDPRPLAERALSGEMQAWDLLFQQHNHRVVVSLLARGVRIDRAKDLAQDAWIRLIEQQREGRLKSLELPGLAITQAMFLALEAARRESGARRTDPLEGESDHVADAHLDAEKVLLHAERLDHAELVLSRCSPAAREVFRLVYGRDGLSHTEAARVVGLSVQRVRQIICEVRKELRAVVEEVSR